LLVSGFLAKVFECGYNAEMDVFRKMDWSKFHIVFDPKCPFLRRIACFDVLCVIICAIVLAVGEMKNQKKIEHIVNKCAKKKVPN